MSSENFTPNDNTKSPESIDDAIAIPAPLARPSTLFSPKVKIGVVFFLVAGGLLYFAWTAFGSATVDFKTVSDVASAGPNESDQTVGVIGKLVKDSYVRSADGVTAHFSLVDEGGSDEMRVQYKGEIGQVFFNDHSEIILQGQMGSDQVFVANTLTVRCPSKYLTKEEQAEIEAQNDGNPVVPPYQPDYFDNKA